MFEPYIFETNETVLPGTTHITVTSCANCPFHQTVEETHEFCSHPEIDPDEPDMDIPCKTFDHQCRTEGYSYIPNWCPLRKLKATVITIPDNV